MSFAAAGLDALLPQPAHPQSRMKAIKIAAKPRILNSEIILIFLSSRKKFSYKDFSIYIISTNK